MLGGTYRTHLGIASGKLVNLAHDALPPMAEGRLIVVIDGVGIEHFGDPAPKCTMVVASVHRIQRGG